MRSSVIYKMTESVTQVLEANYHLGEAQPAYISGQITNATMIISLFFFQQTAILTILTFCIELRHLNLGSCVMVRMNAHAHQII